MSTPKKRRGFKSASLRNSYRNSNNNDTDIRYVSRTTNDKTCAMGLPTKLRRDNTVMEKIKVIVYVEGGLVMGARASVPADQIEFVVWDQDNLDAEGIEDGSNPCIPVGVPDGVTDWDDLLTTGPWTHGIY